MFPIFPFAFSSSSTRNLGLIADTMLQILLPLAHIHRLVFFKHCAFAPLHPILKTAFVHSSIIPHLLSLPVHLAILKYACICHFMLCKVVLTLSVEHIRFEVSFIIASVIPLEVAFTLLNVEVEVASEAATCTLPHFCTTPI